MLKKQKQMQRLEIQENPLNLLYWLIIRISKHNIHNKQLLYKNMIIWPGCSLQLWDYTKPKKCRYNTNIPKQNAVLYRQCSSWYIRYTDLHRDLRVIFVC